MKFMDQTSSAPPLDRSVGARIRERRKASRVSLQVLAQKTGLSIGYLSQIERGISSASLRAMALIAEGLGVDLASLFVAPATEDGDRAVFRVSERRALALDLEGVHKELLTPGGKSGGLRLYLMTIAPGGHSGRDFYSHSGEEAGTVLDGQLSLTVDGTTSLLTAGDAFRFRSTLPHRFSNPASTVTRVLWVNVN